MKKPFIREIAEIYERNIKKRNRITEDDVRVMAEKYERDREIDENYYKTTKESN